MAVLVVVAVIAWLELRRNGPIPCCDTSNLAFVGMCAQVLCISSLTYLVKHARELE
jgi:hypothetical protein